MQNVQNPHGHVLQVTGHCASKPLSHCCCARTGLITKNCANKAQPGTRSWHAVVVVVVVVVVAPELWRGYGEVFRATIQFLAIGYSFWPDRLGISTRVCILIRALTNKLSE